MEFIFNSKQKKIELFYESKEELDAIIQLVQKHLSYKDTTAEIKSNSIILGPDWSSIQAVPYDTITLKELSNVNTVKYSSDTISGYGAGAIYNAQKKEDEILGVSTEGGYTLT